MRLRCPHCQRTLEVPDSAAGKQIRCPACSETTRAPERNPVDARSAPESDVAADERKSLYSSPPASSPLSSRQSNEPSVPDASQKDRGERIACPKCAKMLLVTPELANRIVACPACHSRLRMPSVADAARGVPATLAFGGGAGTAPAGTEPAGGTPPASWSTSAGGQSPVRPSPVRPAFPSSSEPASNPYVSPHEAVANDPYTTPVGTTTARYAAPAARHSEPILYILPGAFQLTFAVILFLMTIAGVVGAIMDFMDGGAPNDPEAVWGLIFILTSLLTTSIVIIGSIQMIRRRSLGLARAAAILAILPCNICCGLPLIPFGIWSTVMLFLPNAPNDFS